MTEKSTAAILHWAERLRAHPVRGRAKKVKSARLLALPRGAAEDSLPYASSTISCLWSDDIIRRPCTLFALRRRGFRWRAAMAQRRAVPRRSDTRDRWRSFSAECLLHGAGQWRRLQDDRRSEEHTSELQS